MRRFTTPTLKFTLKDKKTGEPYTGLVFDYLLLTLSGNNFCMEKQILYEEFNPETAQFSVRLTQEETGSMLAKSTISAEVNIISNEDRIASDIANFTPDINLHNEVIDNG